MTSRGDKPTIDQGLLEGLTSLPFVSDLAEAITTFNMESVTELLERAAYFSLRVDATATEATASGARRFYAEPRPFGMATENIAGRLSGRNTIGKPSATFSFLWRIVPPDYEGDPAGREPLPAIPYVAGGRQRFEIAAAQLRFHDDVQSSFVAYGLGHTWSGEDGEQLAAVLDVSETTGVLKGLVGSIVLSGRMAPAADQMDLQMLIRCVDLGETIGTHELLTAQPPAPIPGLTSLVFLGEVDREHPITLRLSLTEGVVGSNVHESLRTATVDCEIDRQGHLRSSTTVGEVIGFVKAQLSFNPLTLCPVSPVQTRDGVFEFRGPSGRPLGSIFADMREGRSFRTSIDRMLLPVFRFAGFGPITAGTGEFAGASGIMAMNSIISVQPRTLSNLYVLTLDDPTGRFRTFSGNSRGRQG